MTLMADVQAYQQRRNLFDDARVFEFAAIDRAQARNFRDKIADNFRRIRMIAADKDVTFDWIVAVHHVGRNILEGRRDLYFFGKKLGGLLRCRTLPHTEHATCTPAHAGGQWNGSVDEDAAWLDRGLELLKQSRLTFEGHRKDEKIGE